MHKQSKTWFYYSNVVVTKTSKNITESDHYEVFIFYMQIYRIGRGELKHNSNFSLQLYFFTIFYKKNYYIKFIYSLSKI